ncbi:MAG: cell wall-binding repeat-containing protein [Tissierellia bacterium]|nr:cell wall-binding repeat-containing protein [Tissierellia bacterium]
MKKIIAFLLTMAIALQSIAFAEELPSQSRISGSNRYETAVEISIHSFNNSDYVLLANGKNYVDALAASTLAAVLNAPILLTDTDEIPETTLKEIDRLGAYNMIILGGEKTISEKVYDKLLKDGNYVSRIGGKDRYETSELIYDEIIKHKEISEIMIAANEIDALASSPYRSDEIPLIILNTNNISKNIIDMDLKKTVVGGENQINSELFKILNADKRISGSNRYETAVKLSELIDSDEAVIVNSENLVDAFTASLFAIKNNYPILLSPSNRAEDFTKKYIKGKNIKNIFLVGGENMLKDSILEEFTAYREPKEDKIKYDAATDSYKIDYRYFNSFDTRGTEWWFLRPSSFYKGIKATIEDSRKAIVDKFQALWQAPSTGEKTVYLTFDAGYDHNNNSFKILDIAKEKDVKFTFFLTDAYLNQSPDGAKRMEREGHLVGNHSVKHLVGSKLAAESVESVLEEYITVDKHYEKLTGKKMSKFMRPPMGDYSEKYLAILDELGYTPVFWSYAYHDWDINNQQNPETAYDGIIKQIHDGSILLLHAVSDTNVKILPRLIDELRSMGYKIETIDKIEVN